MLPGPGEFLELLPETRRARPVGSFIGDSVPSKKNVNNEIGNYVKLLEICF
jgi:hypothetical protein